MYKTLYSKYNLRYESQYNILNEVYLIDVYVEYTSHIGMCLRHVLQLTKDEFRFSAKVLNAVCFGQDDAERDNNLFKIFDEIEDIFNIKIGIILDYSVSDELHTNKYAKVNFEVSDVKKP